MNEYFIRSMTRQRHEQILAEVRRSRLSQLDRPRMTGGIKKMILGLCSFLMQRKRPMVYRRTAMDESESI